MEEAQVLADKVAIINRGKIAAIGSPQGLISQYGGLKVLVIRNGDATTATKLQSKFDKVSIGEHKDIFIKIDDVTEFWQVMAALTDMKLDKSIEIQTPTLEDVFLKITGARITEEGEMK